MDVATNSTFTTLVTGFNNLDLGNVLTKSITGLSAATTYYVRIRSYDTAVPLNTSANSASVSATTSTQEGSFRALGTFREFGGLFARMPVYSGLAFGIFFAGLGLPGLCGFIGEVFVTLSVWNFSHTIAVLSASVVVLTAGYILWTLQRVYLGAEYKGPHGEDLTPMTARELSIAAPLLALAILFGVYPNAVFRYMSPSVDQEVDQLAKWTVDVKLPRIDSEKEAQEDKQLAKATQ